eukprot:Nitzschia sp. Nitz4//scaffold213_size37731//22307//23941//NITZ4_007723-RA/size37731-processed-gene-0.13-mRNA-1//-1//CDS//3329542074//1068//frame0
MVLEKHVICACTTKPSTVLTPNGGGGSMTVIDPLTGACLSSIRPTADMSGKNLLGISSAASFPQSFSKSTSNSRLVMAYGSNSSKKGDTYAMLLTVRGASSSPILHWKCRLPEADMAAGLTVSPCGMYIVGGASSGSCYIWSSIGNGSLLRTFKAHYRPVTCLAWSDCGRYLATGGADGMVHLFPLMELVDKKNRSSKRNVAPIRTWSSNHFAVTCLTTMTSGRMASAAEDGRIVIMELFSGNVVATIKVPSGVNCLTYHNERLFAGSTQGIIFSLDLSAYSMLQTEKHGATMSREERKRQQDYLAAQESIFGKLSEDEDGSKRLYQTDWLGHERAVTSISILVEDQRELLVSGDEVGQIRVWDVASRACIKVLHPWSHSAGNQATESSVTSDKKSSATHPIRSLLVLTHPSEVSANSGMFANSSRSKGPSGIVSLIQPLQKYTEQHQQQQNEETKTAQTTSVPTPFLKPNRTLENLSYWTARTLSRKRKRSSVGTSQETTPSGIPGDAAERIAQLELELAQKTEEVARWEKVNQKLMTKLQKG